MHLVTHFHGVAAQNLAHSTTTTNYFGSKNVSWHFPESWSWTKALENSGVKFQIFWVLKCKQVKVFWQYSIFRAVAYMFQGPGGLQGVDGLQGDQGQKGEAVSFSFYWYLL